MVAYAIQLTKNWHRAFLQNRLFLFKLILILFVFQGLVLNNAWGELVRTTLANAYIAVSVFVAFTLVLLYGIERLFRFDLDEFNLKYPKFQIVISSFLGALPGCGGAIVVVTQYLQRKVSFGAVIATLTATMGDAAFLLLTAKPVFFLWFVLASFVLGIVAGWIVDKIHGKDFYPSYAKYGIEDPEPRYRVSDNVASNIRNIWWLIFIPGICLGFANAFQIDLDAIVHLPITIPIGCVGAVLSIIVWALRSSQPCKSNQGIHYIAQETSFITVWVIAALLVYESIVYGFNLDLQQLFLSAAPVLPLIGSIVGLIPGCGPQIIVTTLFISGVIPFSAQIGNSISNDGDALFPVLALETKTAILATIYTTIPAILASYSFFFFFE